MTRTRIRTATGALVVRVIKRQGNLAVTPSIGKATRGLYVVTHLPTGRKLGGALPLRAASCVMRSALAAAPDVWRATQLSRMARRYKSIPFAACQILRALNSAGRAA